MRKLLAGLMLTAGLSLAASSRLERAQELYQRTDYAAVLKLLRPVENKDAAAHALIGKAWYMQGDFKKASESLEKAVAAEPDNSVYHNWLGRAYGRRAETSSFITAPGLAGKARDSFERAVQAGPRNVEAMNDLFEYYLEAPGLLGGGLDKASALAQRIAQVDPVEGHYVKARLAEKRKEYGTAEQQLRRAVDAAPKQVGRVIDLAKFLAKQGRFEESDQTFRQAEKIAPESPKVLFERANAYIRAGRNLDTARDLLKRYLASPLTPDDPPRSQAEALLKQVSSS